MSQGYQYTIAIVPLHATDRLTPGEERDALRHIAERRYLGETSGTGTAGATKRYTWHAIGPEGPPPDPGVQP